MKKIKLSPHILAVFIVWLLSSQNIAAQSNNDLFLEAGQIYRNPILTSYFSGYMNSLHPDIYALKTPCYFFLDNYYLISSNLTQINGIIGGMIPLSKNVALPLFGGIVMNFSSISEINMAFNFLAGSGLVIYGEYGLLAGYLGYNYEKITDRDWGETSEKRNVQWGVYPIVNAQKLPLLNIFVKAIGGYFSMDRDDFKPSYKANIVFASIQDRLILGMYAIKDWYDFNTKYDLYAGRIMLPSLFGSFLFSDLIVDAGYRRYFDKTYSPYIYAEGGDPYEDGLYMKIVFKTSDEGGFGSIFIESSSRSFIPVIGLHCEMYKFEFGASYNVLETKIILLLGLKLYEK